MAWEGEREKGNDGGRRGRGERKKKGRGRLVGSPASLRDFHEEGPTRSCSLWLHELPPLSAWENGESKRAQALHGYRGL